MTVFILALIGMVLSFSTTANAEKKTKAHPPERIDAVIMGNRVVNLACHLDLLPKPMSVRCSAWSQCKDLITANQRFKMFLTVVKKIKEHM